MAEVEDLQHQLAVDGAAVAAVAAEAAAAVDGAEAAEAAATRWTQGWGSAWVARTSSS